MRANKNSRIARSKVYNTLAVSVLTYGCEVWSLKKADERIEAAEMRFMRRTAGITLRDRIRSEVIVKNLGVISVVNKVKNAAGQHTWSPYIADISHPQLEPK